MDPIYVALSTYERPGPLEDLLWDLIAERGHRRLVVEVFDDASSADYSEAKRILEHEGWRYTRSPERRGYLAGVRAAHAAARGRVGKHNFFLPDDVRLCDGFFSRAIDAWEQIEDPNKMALNLLVDSREHSTCWTGQLPVDRGHVVSTGWFDGVVLVPQYYFEHLDYEVRQTRLRSDGGWAQISDRLHHEGYGLYRVRDSLVLHGHLPSVMHPEARKQFPLHSVRFVGSVRLGG